MSDYVRDDLPDPEDEADVFSMDEEYERGRYEEEER